jgi:PilZ domain
VVNRKRRRFERHAFRLPVTVRWEGREERATSRTLGLGGLFVVLPDPPAVGTMLALTLTLATPRKRDEVTLQGEVVYADSAGVGIRFVGPPADARARLRGFFLLQDLHCFNTEPPPG